MSLGNLHHGPVRAAPASAQFDSGLGTAYERLAIYRLFDRWLGGRGVATALEGPVDGMAGMQGLHLAGRARAGTHVTVCNPDQAALDRVWGAYGHLGIEDRLRTRIGREDALPRGPFDLVLTYNALPYVADWQGYLGRLAALSSRWLLVAVLNPWSWGIAIRKARQLAGTQPAGDHDHPAVRGCVLEPELRRLGAVVAHEYFDCPWWPDVLDLREFVTGSVGRLPLVGGALAGRASPAGEDPFRHGPDCWPLVEGAPGHETFVRAIARHPVFDGRGPALGRVFGHLHAYLVDVRGGVAP